ncbi:helix-turn-helix transcriptional regulator [Paenibacillus mesotrionivorans]|uniref:Helix-turn-helix transcriptional regulator n=1 Tax=Paenibacillus mesotrionivorans TaxID=3160968 RepID=A0ACC7P0R8_9BACL
MKKTERQNGIVHLLRVRKKMTAHELARYFEVSERTIYRDIDALSQLQVPIIAYEGLGGGYEISPSYFMPSIKLSEQEALMLLMVLKAGEELHIPNLATDYNLLSSKVMNALSDEERQQAAQVMSHIEFNIIRIMPKGYIEDVLKPILEAFGRSCDLRMGYYHPERDETEHRQVSPIRLFFTDGGWYVKGFCHVRQAKRTFRLDRIVSLTCLDVENRYMNKELNLPDQDRFTWFTYELLIDPALYRIIKEDAYLQHTEVKTAANGLHLTIRTPYKNDILQLVLHHPEQVTALQPEAFLQEIEAISQAIHKKYCKP